MRDFYWGNNKTFWLFMGTCLDNVTLFPWRILKNMLPQPDDTGRGETDLELVSTQNASIDRLEIIYNKVLSLTFVKHVRIFPRSVMGLY